MSMKGVLDTCVHIHSFRNIDLFEQGVYMLRVSLNDGTEAAPYLLEQCGDSSAGDHRVIDPFLSDFSFCTRAFVIKYTEEEVVINDFAVFRSETESSPFESSPLTVHVDLLFAESKSIPDLRTAPSLSYFTLLASQQIQIDRSLEGVNQFLPLSFNQLYTCQVNLCLHVIQLDFRYRFRDGVEGYYDLNRLVAQAIFPGLTEVPLTEVELAKSVWVRHLKFMQNKTLALLKTFLEEIGKLDFLPRVEEPPAREYSTNPVEVAGVFIEEIQELSTSIYTVELGLYDVVKTFPNELAQYLQREYVHTLRDHWGGCTFRDYHQVTSLAHASPSAAGSTHAEIATALRKTPLFASMDHFEAYQADYFLPSVSHPVLFQDIYRTVGAAEHQWTPDLFAYMPNPLLKKKGIHLIVFVHGFLGSSYDVKLMKNTIATFRPDCLLLCSNMNEGSTEGDIAGMGSRLAVEVRNYIREWCPLKILRKVSFMGHSLGGLIIRAALPALTEYFHLFHMFITFSSPHLGYVHNSSTLVGLGMWVLKKWRKSECMQQLTMTDAAVPRDTYLYKLSTAPGLAHFKHVALVSSYQDSYAPYESSRIEVDREATDNDRLRLMREMAENLMSQLKTEEVYRLDVNYKSEAKSLDNFIGRTAHIEMLDNTSVLQMILYSCAHFFN